jgi:hypothetical protein
VSALFPARPAPSLQKIEAFDLGARPRRFAQEGQARFDAGIAIETLDLHQCSQLCPTVAFDELDQHHLQGNAVQHIVAWFEHHLPIAAARSGENRTPA